MLIINIFKRGEYLICLLFFLLNCIAFTLCKDHIKNQLLIFIYKVNFSILLIYYFYCIFMESEFDTHCFKIIQMHFENYISIVSLMINLAAIITILIFFSLCMRFLNYQLTCDFYTKQFNPRNKCEIYKINNNKNLPYQLLYSFNPEKNKYTIAFTNIDEYMTPLTCSDIDILLNNNNEEFQQIYLGENIYYIYYCDVKFQSKKFLFDQVRCCTNTLFPEILIILHMYLSVRYYILINIYFKNIKPNINANIILLKKIY